MRKSTIILLGLILCIAATVMSCALLNDNPIKIELDENPTTGYRWEYRLSNDNVKYVSDSYALPDTKPGIVGAGGIRTFIFEKVADGPCTINFYYCRSWEPFPETPDYVYRVN